MTCFAFQCVAIRRICKIQSRRRVVNLGSHGNADVVMTVFSAEHEPNMMA